MGSARRRALARRRAGWIPRRKRRYARRRKRVNRRHLAAASGVAAIAAAIAVLLAFVVLGPPNTLGARVIHFTVEGKGVHRALTETAVIPPGRRAGRPLLVFLHGEGVESASLPESLFAALRRLGARAPDVVLPSGGADSFWHDRSSGNWDEYVVQEVIPRAVEVLHANPRRVAIGGISMGGFGAFDIARLHPGRFCAVGGDSPALWLEASETPGGAFDDAADFAKNDVIGAAVKRSNPYPGARLWLDVGSEDAFRSADTTFAQVLRAKGRKVDFHIWPGGHESGYWDRHWRSYLDFYANALASCHRHGRPPGSR
jgi:enterochelin esterase-like enzyme